MCGIAGIFSKKPVLTSDLEVMMKTLSHRGPDASDLYLSEDRKVGLVHNRLSVIDLSDDANQPMWSGSGQCVLTYNGEIYNYRDVEKALLSDNGIHLRTSSDSEVLLEAYERHGGEFVNELNGMFAFAVYDRKKDQLYLCRDRLGIKPLFYYLDDQHFIFASELKALENVSVVRENLEIDQQALSAYLHLGYVPQPKTIWKQIRKFPAGNFCTVGADLKPNFTPFWTLDDQYEPQTISDVAAAEAGLKEHIERSVGSRMISDVPLGTFLSGGIDSSVVTAVASRLSNSPLKTFTIGFEEGQFDERVYAGRIGRELGTDHVEYVLSEKETMNMVPDILPTFDEPFADSSAVSTALVSKLARKDVTVILTGDGGDELFHGYGSYNWANRLGTPSRRILWRLAGKFMRLGNDRFRRVADLLEFNSQDNLKEHIFSQEQYYFRRHEMREMGLPVEHEPLLASKVNRLLTPAEAQADFDLHYYLRDDLLVKVDRASMKFGLECRVPLLDHQLVQYCLNLSPQLKINNRETKYLLKRVLYDYLPVSYFERPKWGFGIPLDRWLKNDLKFLIHDFLNTSVVKRHGLVNHERVQELTNAFKAGHNRFYNRVWQLIILHQWAESKL